MTREEERENAALTEYGTGISREYDGFLTGAEWADAHPDKQSIVKYLRELGYTVTLNGDVISREQEIKNMEQYVKYQKEKLIEKSCEWLKNNMHNYLVAKADGAVYRTTIFDDLKKYMEEAL